MTYEEALHAIVRLINNSSQISQEMQIVEDIYAIATDALIQN